MAEASNPLMSATGSIVPFAMHVEDNYKLSASTAGGCCACPASELEHLERDLVVEICQVQLVFNVRADWAARGLGPQPNPRSLEMASWSSPDLPRSNP
ncbi:hypothetical protein BQ8482_130246 [Mesorhizobium delmotii]|uniref:Uncharacterized protein n=1 Tax=Mesorhizobium delmotii TaxID=1631247 RepID=A0A2P9AGU6_9HYPH|nr:hypothetical protein BQ8482_130246 [Mesorhizobium delmotii]